MPGTCPSCGHANDDVRFCAACGAELGRRCPTCGAQLAAGAVFCASCGALVGAAPAGAGTAARAAPPAVEKTRIEPRPAAGRGAGGTSGATPGRPAPGASGGTRPAQTPGGAPPPVVPPGGGDRGAGAAPPPGSWSAAPPPIVPLPPTASASLSGGPPRRGPPVWLIVVLIVLVVAAAAAAAIVFLVPGDDETADVTASPTPSASASRSASPSATPSSSPSSTPGFPMAAVTGGKSNGLATVNADGGVTPLTEALGTEVFQVTWSPDGRRIACVAGAWDKARLWIADASSGDVTEVQIATPAVVAVDSVAWLNATELLVAGYTVKPAFQGEVAEFLVYDLVAGAVSGPLEDGAGIGLRGVSVSASANGGRVAFVTYTDQKQTEYGMPTAIEHLELLDRATGAVSELGSGTAYFDVNSRRFDEPLISPDGEAVIYRAAGSDVGTSYTVVDANGSTLMPPRELNFPAGYAWDPTGQKVVFTGHSIRGSGGANDPVVFYVFDRGVGGRAKVLTRYKKTMVQDLSWSPDGATIAFAEWDPDNYETGNIFQLSAEGGDAQLLVREALSPAYRPAP